MGRQKKQINPTTTTVTKEDVCKTHRQQMLFDCIAGGMKLREAAKQAGLSYKYASNWVGKNGINGLVVRENKAKTEGLREEAVRTLANIMRDPQSKPATKIKCVDVLGKMSGWHSQTTVLETGSRQRELTQSEREEAQRLAVLRFNSHAITGTPRAMSADEANFEFIEGLQGQRKDGVNLEEGSALHPLSSTFTPDARQLQVPSQPGIITAASDPITPPDARDAPFPSLPRKFLGKNPDFPTEEVLDSSHDGLTVALEGSARTISVETPDGGQNFLATGD